MWTIVCKWLTNGTDGLVLSLFVCLALGYAIGNIKVRGLSLGATVGTLLAAVMVAAVIGKTAQYDTPQVLRSIFFDLFIFALGFDVGPAFVRSLKNSGAKLIVLAVIFTVVSLGVGAGCYFVLSLSPGELAGLFAGTMTQSTILSTAQTMMESLGIVGDAAGKMNSDMMAAYAVGYLISYAGCVILIKTILPYLVVRKGVQGLREEVQQSASKINHKGDAPKGSLFGGIRLRTFLVSGAAASLTVAELQRRFDERLQVEAVIHDASGESEDFDASYKLAQGDVITLLGDLERMAELNELGLNEVTDQRYQKAVITKDKMVVTKELDAEKLAVMYTYHVMPTEATRNGKALEDLTSFLPGDVVTVMGSRGGVQKVIRDFGYPVDSGEDSNVIYLSAGVIAGILLGIVTVTIAGVPISFSASGGVMFLGIFCGWLNDKRPNIGYISPGARWLMKSMCLNLFVACLGLNSGASFISSIQSMGAAMIIAVIVMSFLPHIITLLIGKHALRLDAVEALGGICGAGTNTAALNGLMEETGSSIFAAAYTPAYAVANISLTFLGTICVALFH